MRAAQRKDWVFLAGLAGGVVTLLAGVLRDEIGLITVGAGILTGVAAKPVQDAANDDDGTNKDRTDGTDPAP